MFCKRKGFYSNCYIMLFDMCYTRLPRFRGLKAALFVSFYYFLIFLVDIFTLKSYKPSQLRKHTELVEKHPDKVFYII